MRGYMTMKQAFECGDNDIPFIDGEYNSRMKHKKHILQNPPVEGYQTLRLVDALSDKWQVKSAEPVVLSENKALEIWENSENKSSTKCGIFLDGFQAGKPNGRLERDLELRGLVNKINHYASTTNFLHGSEAGRDILRAALSLKPLKPLNKDSV